MCQATLPAKPKKQKREPMKVSRMRVRLANYDWIVVNSSGGKDSQAMLHEVCRLAKELGILHRVVVVHADLGQVEWEGTKELAQKQAEFYGVRFMIVGRKQGDLLDHVLDRSQKLKSAGKTASPWPSSTARWCTSDHKRAQVGTVITALSREVITPIDGRRIRVLNCMGLRSAESSARSKKMPFLLNWSLTTKRRVVHNYFPVFDWGVEKVWETIRQSGAPYSPVYDLGMPRLSCCFCVFMPKNALMLAGKHNPELLTRYVEVEKTVGSHFRLGLPIVEIKEALERGEEPGEITSWEGM